MREYRLYTINYMKDLNYKTDNSEDMKRRVEEISKFGNKDFFEGAYIVVLENGKEIENIDWYKF